MTVQNLFKNNFLKGQIFTNDLLNFTNEELYQLDKDLSLYEQMFLNPDIENNLISKNELLASFGISKAENSALTLKEAEDLYKLIKEDKDLEFIKRKISEGKKLTQGDYDKLEFYNISKTFRALNQNQFKIKDLSVDFILELHKNLTKGLDIFKDYLFDFTVYKPGKFRENNQIRVGTYIPADYKDIEDGVAELISWLKKNYTINSIGIFHTALYALHPFNNGNKRVSRVLEHLLIKGLGFNKKNLYATSYYYHKEKERYYKYLFYSLDRKNLNHFTSFFQEALVFSIISVVKTSIEVKRLEFLDVRVSRDLKDILKPLVKKREIQFKNLFKISKRKFSRQTFSNYLQVAVNEKLVIKREEGRNTYYSLNVSVHEETVLKELIDRIKPKITYIPDEIKLS